MQIPGGGGVGNYVLGFGFRSYAVFSNVRSTLQTGAVVIKVLFLGPHHDEYKIFGVHIAVSLFGGTTI